MELAKSARLGSISMLRKTARRSLIPVRTSMLTSADVMGAIKDTLLIPTTNA